MHFFKLYTLIMKYLKATFRRHDDLISPFAKTVQRRCKHVHATVQNEYQYVGYCCINIIYFMQNAYI